MKNYYDVSSETMFSIDLDNHRITERAAISAAYANPDAFVDVGILRVRAGTFSVNMIKRTFEQVWHIEWLQLPPTDEIGDILVRTMPELIESLIGWRRNHPKPSPQ